MFNCMLTGVGGQGTVLLSRLIGAAAIKKGLFVCGAETIGMAQRGGSVVSHVRIGEGVSSPLMPQKSADLLIAFEPAEAVRSLEFLKKDGSLIVLDRAVRPVSSALAGDYKAEEMVSFLKENVKNLTVVKGDDLIEKCKNVKVINVALLGLAVQKNLLPFDMETARQVLSDRLPKRFLELNLKALEIGADIADV